MFTFSQSVGAGLPMWLPRGTQLRLKLEDFLKRIQKRYGYQQVMTPHIGAKQLYVTSGHYAKYGKDSFQPIHTPQEGEEYLLKPMNCPHHCEIFKAFPRSYKDLPLRLAEFGTVYRYEQSGELHGLTRVRGFTQDDAHLFCRPDQLKDEFLKVMDIVMIIFKSLDFENFEAQISLRDKVNREKYIGSDENWEKAEQAIIEACEEKGLNAKIEYGEAAFYGPKLDFMVKDAIGRRWQLGTIQVDYNLPERFELEYTGEDNKKHRPVMIHRAPFGSMERFVAVLIEHTGGKFPLWLTPDQVSILPISEKFNEYAYQVARELEEADLSVLVDDRNEKIGRKIRDTELKRVHDMLIGCGKEAGEWEVFCRKQGGEDEDVHQYFTGQYEKYLYDPNSPFYNETLFSFVLQAMLESASLDDLQKYRPAYLLELISKNKVGEQATDFFYTDSKNKQNPLAAITADYTLLFFYNPDCDVCQNYKQSMQQSALLNNLLDSGKLAILAIYTDDDTEAWRAYASEIPTKWINGYDQQQIIKNDELYDLKAIPTLYLLDKEKKVILKDTNLSQIDSFFQEQQK